MTVKCCDLCFETIAKKSTDAAKMWLDICALRIKRQGTLVLHSESKEIKLLENMRFIVTMEDHIFGSSRLVLGLYGLRMGEDNNFTFCIGENHD